MVADGDMMASIAEPAPVPHPAQHGLRFGEFVALSAALMALSAAGIDAMLPALPAIGAAMAVASANDWQWIITAYFMGNGAGQVFFGVLGDRFGRRPVILGGALAYVVLAGLAAFSSGFGVLIGLRFLHGVASSSSVVVRSVVRDCYSGAQMARVMSLTFVIFLSVPVLAPSFGQVILLVGTWRWIFGFLALFGTVVFIWAALRLPETLHESHRRALEVGMIVQAARLTLSNRMAAGYMLAVTFLMGPLVGFLGSVQQICAETLHAPTLMTGIFAFSAGSMGVASYLNSRIVHRFGVRFIAHWALVAFIASASIHALVAFTGHETVVSFALLQAATMSSFALSASNFGSIAMEPMASIAGFAASVQGVVSTLGGAILGAGIGQLFDGTSFPLAFSATLCGLAAACCVAFAERGRLFRREAS